MKIEQKIFILVALIASVSFLSYPGSAESGSITVDNSQGFAYTWDITLSPTPSFNTFYFDSNDYERVVNFTVVDVPGTMMSYTHESEITTFVVSSGGTGSGVASYSRALHHVNWVYTEQTQLTSSTVVLTYAKNIFANVSLNSIRGGGTPSVTKPMCIAGTALGLCFGGGFNNAFSNSAIGVGYSVTNTYVVTYPLPGFFQIDVSKAGQTIQTKSILHSASSIYQTETTFNTNDYSFFGSQMDGIYLNITTADNQYSDNLINSTDIDGYVPPDEALIPDPITGVGIQFNKATYTQNDIANISWIRTINTPLLCTDYVLLQTPNEKYDLVVSPSNSGYTKELLSLLGTYTVSFERDCLFSTLETLGSNSAFVSTTEQTSYINAPSYVGVGQLFNVTYLIGWTKTTGSTVWLRDYSWDNNTNSYSSTYQSWALSGNKNVETNHSIIVTKTGKHLIKICDVLLGCKASTTLNAYFNGSEVTTNISKSNITLDKSSYSYGETMLVKIAVDNYNWSNKQIVVEYYDEDEGLTQNQYYVQEQIESIPLYISDLTFSGSGTALMRLVGRNTTGEYILATASFSLSNIDAEGYGLSVMNEKCKGDIVQIKVIVPAGETGNLSISADDVKYNKNYMINGTKIISYKYPISGSYYITLRVNDEAKRVIIKTITDCGVPVPATTYTGINGTWKSTQDNIQATCSFWDTCVRGVFGSQGVNDVSRLLFALGCIASMMFVGMVASKGNFGVSIVLGFLPYAFFTYLSTSTPCGQYMPLWVTIFIALIIGIKMRWFS